jgi:ribosomal protein S18 acetylase RimI-like enzyme
VLGRQDLGHRVVVRRIVEETDGRRIFSDTLGRLTELTGTHLIIQTDAASVCVPLNQVHRAKRVPDRRRPSRREIAALELAANAAWPAPVTDRLGDWWLRTAQGWTGRASSALPIGDPGVPIPEAVDAVVEWYARHGAHPMVNVPLPYAAAVDAELARRGWAHRPPVLVQTAALADVVSAAPERSDLPPVRLTGAPSPGWLAVAAGRKGGLPDAALHVLTAVRHLCFAEVYADDDEPLAVARGTVTSGTATSGTVTSATVPDPVTSGTAVGDWFGISVVEVRPADRRRGLAQHVIGALARWAADTGATRAFLQVEEHNTPAVALYERLGYTTHHRYLTRYAPPG